MARLSVIATAVAGALLAITASAAPAPVDTVPGLCNPIVCMSLAVLHSDCFDGLNPGPVVSDGVAAVPTQVTNCVCADPKLKESYLSCYGFCALDEATEPFCGQPVDQASEDDDQADVDTHNAKLDDPFGLTHSPDFVGKCRGPNCDKWDPSMAGVWNYCGVPGQACPNKVVESSEANEVAERDATEAQHPEVTAMAELEARNKPHRIVTIPIWTNFCGVVGQACGENKIAAPTAAPGSDFVDVGDVQSEALEGKVGGSDKRAVAVADPMPTTLQTVQDYRRLSI